MLGVEHGRHHYIRSFFCSEVHFVKIEIRSDSGLTLNQYIAFHRLLHCGVLFCALKFPLKQVQRLFDYPDHQHPVTLRNQVIHEPYSVHLLVTQCFFCIICSASYLKTLAWLEKTGFG